MLHLILGRAGSGKTTALYEQIARRVEAGGRAILLVPEQFSFESEKALYRLLGAKGAAQVEVLSFTRLCDDVFRRYGGLASTPLTDTGRNLLMAVALGEMGDTLTIYRSQLANIAFVSNMVETMGAFKTAGSSPQDLLEFSRRQEPGLLRDKTGELAVIYQAYQALIDRGYSDPEDALTRATAQMEEDFFGDRAVFIDSFVAFMANEYHMLGRILSGAPEVWATFCCDSLQDEEEGLGVFSAAKETASRLVRMAKEEGVAVAAPQKLGSPVRFRSRELQAVEAGFLQGSQPVEEPEGTVCLLAARDCYDELVQVASDIRRLVEEEGWSYRDFAIICRTLEPYAVPVSRVLERYGIPYFMDTRRPAETTPLAAAALAALEAVRGSYRTEPLLRFAKSLALGLPPEELARLENYCYIWDVKGRDWLSPFRNHPAGLSSQFTDRDRTDLEQLNELRERVVQPLKRLEERVRGGSGREFAAGVYELLVEIDAPGQMQKAALALEEAAGRLFLDEQAAVWEELMQLLDLFGQVIGERRLPFPRMAELFQLGLASITVGQIPQTLDQVMVGMADRIRPDEPRCTYVVGAVEGEFPRTVGGGGIFTPAERARLEDGGIQLSGDPQVQAARERYYAYFALTTPSHRLQVSYPRAGLDGEKKAPSVLISQLEEILGHSARETPFRGGSQGVWNPATAMQVYSEQWEQDTPLRSTLSEFLTEAGEPVERLGRPCDPEQYRLTRTGLSEELYGRELRLSPSSVERFYQCPFLYFCRDGLRIRPRKKVEFDPMESGSVIHLVLQTMVERHGGAGLALLEENRMRRETEEIIHHYLEEQIEDMSTLPSRFQYLYTRLVGSLVRLLQQLGEEFRQCDFTPVAFELPIAQKGPVPPLVLETADGMCVQVEGTVDRVDLMERDGCKYVRVVDYKSGRKTFSLSDVLGGLNMQMLLYLFSIWENGTGELAGCVPAGVLYMPAQSRFIPQDRDSSPQQAADALRSSFKMNGLLLDDPTAIEGMEREVGGVFIPAKRKKDGGWDSNQSTLATLAQMGLLKERVEENLRQMATLLRQGEIAARPVSTPGHVPCDYCDFRSVCGWEEGKRPHPLPRLKTKEVLESLAPADGVEPSENGEKEVD